MNRFATKLTTLSLALALGAVPLVACGNAAGSGTDTADAPAATSQAAVDVSSWATLGDALAIADPDETPSWSTGDTTFTCVFKSDGIQYRVVSDYDSAVEGKFAELEFDDPEYNKKFAEIVGSFKVQKAEEISSTLIGSEELNAFVGKTGQDLIDAGFVFEDYFMYGGEQTGGTYGNGYYAYEFTFDTKVAEDKTEDGGEALLGATIVEAQGLGNLSHEGLGA